MYRLNPGYLRRRRRFLGLSQAEVAQRACIGLRTYHRVENNKEHNVTKETAKAIADALKTELEYLAVERTTRMVHSIYIDPADDLELVEDALGFELTEAWWWEWTSRGLHVETPVTHTQVERLDALDSVTVAPHRLHRLTPEVLRQQLMDGLSKAAATLSELMGIIYGSAQAPDQSGRGTVTTSTGSRIVRNASSGVISGRMMMSSILDQTARESWALPYIIPELIFNGEVPGGCCPLCKQQLGVDAR